LKPIPDPAVDEALRASLPKLKGKLLAGVIDTIGHRQDTKAVDPLVKLLSAVDLEVAQAGACTLRFAEPSGDAYGSARRGDAFTDRGRKSRLLATPQK
jgi:hypothetical protein